MLSGRRCTRGWTVSVAAALLCALVTTAPAQQVPKVGDAAPGFLLTAASGSVIDLAQYKGTKNVLLVFYRTYK